MRSPIFAAVAGMIFFTSLSMAVAASGQDDDRETRRYETGPFTELFLEGSYNVELIQGRSHYLEMKVSDPKAFDYLEISNKGNLLHVHVDRKPFDFSRITIFVTFETLKRLRIYGSIKLETRGYIEVNNLNMLLEGGAKIKFKAKAHKLSLDNRGGVLVELMGVTDVLDMYLAGTGHIDAGELKAGQVDFRIDGVGTGKVFATNTLNATIKGAGKIRYLGNPKVHEDIDGLGSVSRE